MATELTAGDIHSRFRKEQEDIELYRRFVCDTATVCYSEVAELDGILEEYGLSTSGIQPSNDSRLDQLSESDYQQLLRWVTTSDDAIKQAISRQELRLTGLSGGRSMGGGRDVEDLASVLAQRFRDPDRHDIAEVEACATGYYIDNILSDASTVPPDMAAVLAAARAEELTTRQKLRRLQHVADRMTRFSFVDRATCPSAATNIFRQGFILLMTAFDAAVFDLVRVALRKNFFALVGAFGKQDKISLQEMGELGSFEGLRERVIEDQLKKRYVKDLLHILAGEWGVECVDSASGDTFGRLIELVLRRNVHVHNRGFVDERYLERDQNGRPRFNLDNLSLGDVAVIDEQYWQMASRMCGECVRRVTAWAEA